MARKVGFGVAVRPSGARALSRNLTHRIALSVPAQGRRGWVWNRNWIGTGMELAQKGLGMIFKNPKYTRACLLLQGAACVCVVVFFTGFFTVVQDLHDSSGSTGFTGFYRVWFVVFVCFFGLGRVLSCRHCRALQNLVCLCKVM